MNITGIDDIGTGTQKSEGWTYFSIPKNSEANFNKEASQILAIANISVFHGKDFKRKKARFYKQFFDLIKSTMISNDGAFIACCIQSESWKAEYLEFSKILIQKSYSNANIKCDWLISASAKLAAPLFTYMRLSESFSAVTETTVEIDKHSILNLLNNNELIINNNKISNSIPIYAVAKAYREQVFPKAPLMIKDGLSVVRDEASFVVQAADMFGNFAIAHAYKSLGKVSNTTSLKSDIFAEAFPELNNSEKVTQNLTIKNNEIHLKQNGAFTIKLVSPSA